MENWSFLLGTTDLWTLQQVILSRATSSTPTVSYYHCLQTHYMPEEHTAANIRGALSETLQLETQLVEIVIDSSSKVCELLKWKRLSCFGHNLNLAVEKGLNDARVQRVLRLCKSVVATFSRSWKKQRDLTIIQEQKGLPTHKLKADVVTRWGSSYEMVERLLEQMEAVRVI
jgi:hypothetical protein